MELEQRFTNFKTFVEQQVPNSMIVFMLKTMSLQGFLALMIKMTREHPACSKYCGGVAIGRHCSEHAAEIVMKKLDLDPAQFTPEALAKFKLYCEYFMGIIPAS